MGADYYSKAIIGIPITVQNEKSPRAKIIVRKKAFRHSFEDDGETEFHPKDGRKLWLDEKEEITADYPAVVFDLDGDFEDIQEGQTLVIFPESLEVACGTDQENWYIGCVVETGSSNGGCEEAFISLPDIEELKKALRISLEPHGLWDESKFGLYSVLYCSY
jgi:hypothetical protein